MTDLDWSGIKRPDVGNEWRVRLVPIINCDAEINIGLDQDGRMLLIIDLDGDYRKQLSSTWRDLKGIDLDLRDNPDRAGHQHLVIALCNATDGDIFKLMAESLCRCLEGAKPALTAFTLCIKHLQRWRAFLMAKNPARLSAEEVRGLFGELTLLAELIDRSGEPERMLEGWTGSDKSAQDFTFPSVAVEVKTRHGLERGRVSSSSQDQLETCMATLILMVFALTEVSSEGTSLNGLVDEIRDRLASVDAVERFEEKLLAARYLPLKHYDLPLIKVTGQRAYKVDEGFPRIIRSRLTNGVSHVRYHIDLSAIEPFSCDHQLEA